jgi:hypothetical protein
MVHGWGGTKSLSDDEVSRRTLKTFFEILRQFVSDGVTVVAEAAFQDGLWRPGLEPLVDLAAIRIIQCAVDPALARERIIRRLAEHPASRASQNDRTLLEQLDSGALSLEAFQPISISAPSLRVDTTSGYDPDLDRIIGFVNQR